MAKGGYQKQRIANKKAAERRARKRRARNKKIARVIIPLVVVALFAGVTALVLTGGDDGTTASNADDKNTECTKSSDSTVGQKEFTSAPCMEIDTAKTYTATFDTSVGSFTMELLDDKAPKTVNNFVFLARNRFYEGQTFHRIIKGFMSQGGDPQGTGAGGPGYRFEDENTTQPFDEAGLLAMANSGPGTNGSQFFITANATGAAHLNTQCPGPQGCHSIFGKVTDGLDVVVAMNEVPTGQGDIPVVPVTIRSITITEE